MENDPKWHGMALPEDLAKKALEELGFDPKELDILKEKEKFGWFPFLINLIILFLWK